MGKINIYRASAGSGKTHRLTQEYLKLLKGDDRAYRKILAVTFTNKATEEMKRRVIEYLYKESSNGDSSASRLLKYILHDYSAFNISTIDKFFQQTLRAFAREIGKNTSYGVELNHEIILSQAIDRILFNLDTQENKRLLEWIMELSVQRIDSGKNWDVKSTIINSASQLFKEAYKIAVKGEGKGFFNKDQIAEYSSEIRQITVRYEEALRGFAKRGSQILKESNLTPSDFSGKGKSFAHRFKKILDGDYSVSKPTFTNAASGYDVWFTKSSLKDNPGLADKGRVAERLLLGELINSILDYEELNYRNYSTACVIKDNLYALGLMTDIQECVNTITAENGVMLISETSELLNDIIDGSDTPFIFEKIGSRTDHFMLDEFQDTSLMQWENFRPLLINSLSSGYSNLIVGDEKQSIYRFRGSDWTLLNKTVFDDFRNDEINYTPLVENWRSGKQIVDFINEFFPFAVKSCDNLLDTDPESKESVSSIYSSVEQGLPESRKSKRGYVKIKIVTNDSEDPKDEALSFVKESIDSVVEKGGLLRDIAVLVRKNTEGSLVAEYLIDAGIKVISGDSLFLTSASSVSTIISQLIYFSNPLDAVNNIFAKFSGLDLSKGSDISSLPLYEMCESLADMLPEDIKKSESAYIISFMDQVKDYIRSNRADLASFLDWWSSNSGKLTVPAPEGDEAVRIMTIHKSKGLGFSTVIVPFTEFEFKGKPDIMWCKPQTAPFNKMPLVPVYKSDILEETHFRDDLKRENFLRVVDSMNLTYVAFTRAKDNLFICVEEPASSSKSVKGAGDIVFSYFASKLNEKSVLIFGESVVIPDVDRKPVSMHLIPMFKSHDNSDNLRLTLRSEEFFNKEEISRARGVVIHSILSKIKTAKDIEMAVKNAVSIGELEKSDENQVINYFSKLIKSVEKYNWFTHETSVMTEQEIIIPGGKIYRPDRIINSDEISIVDFKTGKLKTKSHQAQIERYAASLKQMTVKKIRSYLWYLDVGEIIEVI